MTPHDMLGIAISQSDIVVIARENRKLNFAVVTKVNDSTGSIEVKSVVLDEVPALRSLHLPFPALQVCIVTETFKHRFVNSMDPEHIFILQLHKEHSS